jgi:hypothetical protein
VSQPGFKAVQHLARPDVWAQDLNLRVDGRPFSVDGREYIIPVIRDTSPKLIVKKAAQTAFTITFLTRTMAWIVSRGWHHLYLLPLKTGAVPFVQKRIDPIIASNEILSAKFKSVDNRTHKQTAEDISLLIRGTNVESELQETPTDVVVFDEYDRMVQDFLEDAKHRTDGSNVKRLTYLSTPTVPGHGLDSDDMWHASDMMKWHVKCPGCGRFQTFVFEENVKIGENEFDCVLECAFCSRVWKDRERADANAGGHWDAVQPGAAFRGYHINQFNSPTMALHEIMESYFLGMADAKKMKAFFNQSLGEPYTSPGNQITLELLDACKDSAHHLGGIPAGGVYLGIDVGHDEIFVEADYINRFKLRCLWNLWHFKDTPGKTAWEMLDEKVLSKLGSWVCVCDAHPDKRGANALAMKYPGRFFMGFEKDRPEQEEIANWDKVKYGEATKVIIDRTLAFDSVIFQMMQGNYILPPEARELGEVMPRRDYNAFYSHMIQMVRVEEEDLRGRIVASWKKNKNPDHWHHTNMFAFVATLKRAKLAVNTEFGDALRQAGTPSAA